MLQAAFLAAGVMPCRSVATFAQHPDASSQVNGYQGHSPRIQTDIVDDELSAECKPQMLLRTFRQQIPDPLSPADLRLDRGFAPGQSSSMTARVKHVNGYRGFQRGNKCKEVGNL